MVKPVRQLGLRTPGWHASLIVTELTYDTTETKSYTQTVTTVKYYDFAAGGIDGKVGQYMDIIGDRDFREQMSEGEVIWHTEDKDGALLAELKHAAMVWKPEGIQQNYFFMGNGSRIGSNSNNYIAYLLASIGQTIDRLGFRHFAPGIHRPTKSTNTIPIETNGWWESTPTTSTYIHYSYKEGG